MRNYLPEMFHQEHKSVFLIYKHGNSTSWRFIPFTFWIFLDDPFGIAKTNGVVNVEFQDVSLFHHLDCKLATVLKPHKPDKMQKNSIKYFCTFGQNPKSNSKAKTLSINF